MNIGSVPWNIEPITVHEEDKWCRIIALDIGCKFDLAGDFGHPRKEVNPCITLRVEV